MADADSKCSASPQAARAQSALEIVFDAAVDSLVSAGLVWILGGVALSIAGGFTQGMVPSLPPAFAGQPQLEAGHPAHGFAWWGALRREAFVIFYAIFFLHSLWVGFHGHAGSRRGRVGRILAKVREDWFSLIVGNAIQAWVAVLLLGIMQNVSYWHWIWQAVSGAILAVFEPIAHAFLGKSGMSSLSQWISWYGANQAKLNFWIVYLGGAFDDLGVPNFKSLVRWSWRRMRNCNKTTAPVTAQPTQPLPPPAPSAGNLPPPPR